MRDIDFDRYKNLTFEDFRRLAEDESLSQCEKIGFPDSYRQGKEASILSDLSLKLRNLNKSKKLVMDIGAGCSGLALLLIELCRRNEHRLILIDSKEMLNHLPDEPFVTKVPAYYPGGCPELFNDFAGKVDTILAYSILHYVFAEGSVFDFLDRSLVLLSPGGEMLIGDIPNISKRKRFFSSQAGVEFHQRFTQTNEVPAVTFNTPESGQIDDAVIVSLILRCRQSGFDAYWVPQADDLPMANRREDILIRKP